MKADWFERPWVAPSIAALTALVLRLLYVMSFRHSVAFDAPVMDEAVHDLWARGRLSLFYEGIPYFRAPLYPWFLELIYKVHEGYLLPRVVQSVLSAFTVGLVADLGRRLAGPVAGLASGLLLAFCWPVIFFAGELLIVTLFSTLVVLALWLLVRATLEDRVLLAWGGALVLGLSAIGRPTSLSFLPALVLLVAWAWRHPSTPRLGRRSAVRFFSLLLLMLLPGLTLSIRNKVVGEDWVFIASQGGVNFYIGNNAQSDGRTAVVPGTRATWLGGYEDTINRANASAQRMLRPSEVSRYYFVEGLRFWREEPGQALKLYARKLRLLFGAAERSNNKNLHFWRDQNVFLRLPIYTSWAVLLGLGLTGLILGPRRRESTALWAFLALYAVGILLFFINERFRLPLMIVLSVYAGIPVAQIVAAATARRWSLAILPASLALLIFLVSSADRMGFRGDHVEADAFSWHTLGNMYLRKSEYDQAASAYLQSLDIGHRFGLTHFDQIEAMLRRSLIVALMRTGRTDAVEEQVRLLRVSWPDDPDNRLVLGQYHLWKKEPDQALSYFRSVVDEQPRNVDALLGLGWVQLQNLAYTAGERTFRKVLALEPNQAEAVAGIGAAELMGRRNQQRAKEMLERAVRLDPSVPQAHQFLAEIYRVEKDVGKMIYHLRECLRLDPHNEYVRRFLVRLGVDLEHPQGDRPR